MPAAPLALLGWIGAVLLLAGYVQVSRGRYSGDGRHYQALTLLGSLGLGLAAVGGRVWSSVALNATWVAIGVVTLLRGRTSRRSWTSWHARTSALRPSGAARSRRSGCRGPQPPRMPSDP
jgi:hypothetical protein